MKEDRGERRGEGGGAQQVPWRGRDYGAPVWRSGKRGDG